MQKNKWFKRDQKKKERNGSNTWDLQGNIKHANLHIIGILSSSRRKRKENGDKRKFEEIMAETSQS